MKTAIEGGSISEEDVSRVLAETKKEYDDEVSRHENELEEFKARKDEEIEAIRKEMNEIQEVLGRIHEQKVFYASFKDGKPYVSG